MRDSGRPQGNRIDVETAPARRNRTAHPYGRRSEPRGREAVVAFSVIAAAALATSLALFITSRPYDPMNSTVDPDQAVPQGPITMQSSPKPSPTATASSRPEEPSTAEQAPEPAGQPSGPAIPDDAAIQSEIEKVIAADAALADLDVSTIVEGGKVTMVGSVKSPELKLRVEKAVRSVKGVVSVNNQLVITQATP